MHNNLLRVLKKLIKNIYTFTNLLSQKSKEEHNMVIAIGKKYHGTFINDTTHALQFVLIFNSRYYYRNLIVCIDEKKINLVSVFC